MIKFIKSMLAGKDGTISSKRSVMFLFALLFAGIVVSNHITGLNVDSTLKEQLFWLLIWLVSMVFGEQIPDMIKAMKNKGETKVNDDKPAAS